MASALRFRARGPILRRGTGLQPTPLDWHLAIGSADDIAETAPKPGVFGYLAGWAHDPTVEAKRQSIMAFAAREGYELVHIYEETAEGGPALAAVIEATQASEARALLIHAISDLGSTTQAQKAAKRRLKTETGVPVLLVEARR